MQSTTTWGKELGYMPCVKTLIDANAEIAAYETEIIWEPDAGPKLVQRMLGNVDPETGIITRTDPVPLPGFTTAAGSAASDSKNLKERLNDATTRNLYLEVRLQEMTNENKVLRDEVQSFRKQLGKVHQYLRRAETSIMGVQDALDLSIGACQVNGVRP